MDLKKRYLVLEDGKVYSGYAFGSDQDVFGEVVFNTAMTGYQETISDPSYTGQIVTFTYPLIGNYGMNRDDYETIHPSLKGVVVREVCELPSNFRNEETLDQALKRFNVPGIYGVDTRSLTKRIRNSGVMKGALVDSIEEIDHIVEQINTTEYATNEVEQVSTKSPYVSTGKGYRVVLVDFGKKQNIVRELNRRDCDVTVVPHNITAEEIIQMNPDGIMLSNGPGDPTDVQEAIEMLKVIQEKFPVFGICLGHQLFALANGATTFKMKFGHRGANHPVLNIETNKVELTSQNHGYSVSRDSLEKTQLIETHRAINDNTVEGLKHKEHLAFSVQYHPEAAPGPHDPNYLFDQFIENMKIYVERKKGGRHHA